MPLSPRPDIASLLRRPTAAPFDAEKFLAALCNGRHYRGQISAAVELPACSARYQSLAAPLPQPLRNALREIFAASTRGGAAEEEVQLFTHQAQAVESARRGENFVVVSGTASGKTLCYHLPILETHLANPAARALYLYPTKALAQDQLRGLLRLQEAGGFAFRCGTYDGDTPSSQRASLRDRGAFILTNPDMLHAGILPQHAKWAPFFENLRHVVIDEVHSYRGIFGSNFANVLRRLRRICRHYGSAPQFLCASATIANPQELCEKLCGADFTFIDDDGAPRGKKQFVLWNPPLLKEEGGRRKDEIGAASNREYSQRDENRPPPKQRAGFESPVNRAEESPQINALQDSHQPVERATDFQTPASTRNESQGAATRSPHPTHQLDSSGLPTQPAAWAAGERATNVRSHASTRSAESQRAATHDLAPIHPPDLSAGERADNFQSNASTRDESQRAPTVQSADTSRRSPNSEAMHLFTALIRSGVPTIAFVRARVVAELLLRYTQDELARRAPQLLNRVRSYRGGYLASERREIERQLFDGELLGVVATSALELGIDVGALDACLMVGYPGSIASLWQRAGRAGRSGGSSLAMVIASENPIDQYLMHHPDYLLGRAAENAVIDADNAYILAKHLRCACAELPISLGEARAISAYAPALLQLLEEENQLRRAADSWFWARSGSPSRDVSLRNAGDESFTITDVERGQIIGTVDEATAFQLVHDGAIYLHEAETFFIEKLDLETRSARARRSETDYFTQAMSEAQIRIEGTDEEKTWRDSSAAFGAVTVTFSVTGFKKVKFGSLDSLGFAPLTLPPQELETVAMWLRPPPDSLRRLREYSRAPLEALLGIANAALAVLPLRVLCDAADIGAVVDSAQLGTPALFLFDKYPGGLGFSQRAYDLLEDVMSAAHAIITECPCDDGCPSCVGSAAKTFTYYDAGGEARARIPDKEAALVVLHEVLGLPPYVPQNAPPGTEASTREPIPQLPPQVEDKVRRQLQRMKKF